MYAHSGKSFAHFRAQLFGGNVITSVIRPSDRSQPSRFRGHEPDPGAVEHFAEHGHEELVSIIASSGR